MMVLVLATASATGVPAYGQKASQPPKFEDYKVAGVYHGPVRRPHFRGLDRFDRIEERCLGSDPETYAEMQANFGGRFVLSPCTCGAGCRFLLLWDAENGRVYGDFPFKSITIGPYDAGSETDRVEYSIEQYRVDSSLLVLDGCFEGSCDCAKRYYVWTGKHFKLIYRQEDRLPRKCR